MTQNRQAGRRHSEGESDALMQNVGAQRKAALRAENAYSLVAAARGEKRTLTGFAGESIDHVAGLVRDVVAVGGDGAQQIQLRAQRPSSGLRVPIDQPDLGE